jgi:hypothetical protein
LQSAQAFGKYKRRTTARELRNFILFLLSLGLFHSLSDYIVLANSNSEFNMLPCTIVGQRLLAQGAFAKIRVYQFGGENKDKFARVPLRAKREHFKGLHDKICSNHSSSPY